MIRVKDPEVSIKCAFESPSSPPDYLNSLLNIAAGYQEILGAGHPC